MRNLPMPIRVPTGYKLVMTQPYANTTNNAWYTANGINIPFHNGIDLVISKLDGTEARSVTYGAPLITPSPGWTLVKVTWDTPMSTKGNGVTLESPEYVENGVTKRSQIVYWHCSGITDKRGSLPAFTEVAYVGNSGAVFPKPTPECPFCGSHVHLMLFDYTKHPDGYWTLDNNNNGVGGAIDPLTRFSMSNVIYGADSSRDKDVPALRYFFEQLKAKFNSLYANQ